MSSFFCPGKITFLFSNCYALRDKTTKDTKSLKNTQIFFEFFGLFAVGIKFEKKLSDDECE